MIIESIDAIPLQIPFKPGASSDAAAWADRNPRSVSSLLVKIATDDGLVGWGETFGFRASKAAKCVINEMIAPLCIGQDASLIAPLMHDVQRKLHLFGRSGPVMYGLSAIDIALWDLAGKAANAPVHRLLGGTRAAKLPCYASMSRYSDPALVRDQVGKVLAAGFRSVKLHEIEPSAVRAAREAAGPEIGLMLDVNCAWNLDEAFAHTSALAEFGLRWLEEPIWPPENFQGLAELRRRAVIPIAAGENASTQMEFDRMMAAGAVDIVQPSPAKMGGLTELAKVVAIAAARNVTVMLHSFYDGPGLLAAIHATAALGPSNGMIEWRDFDLEARVYDDALTPANGHVIVPSGPGLGFEPDEAVIRAYAVPAS